MGALPIIPTWLEREAQRSVGKQEDRTFVECAKNLRGEMSMNAEKAVYVNGKKGTPKPKGARVCVHQRMLDYHYNEKAQPSGNLLCRECGAVIPDSANVLA